MNIKWLLKRNREFKLYLLTHKTKSFKTIVIKEEVESLSEDFRKRKNKYTCK